VIHSQLHQRKQAPHRRLVLPCNFCSRRIPPPEERQPVLVPVVVVAAAAVAVVVVVVQRVPERSCDRRPNCLRAADPGAPSWSTTEQWLWLKW